MLLLLPLEMAARVEIEHGGFHMPRISSRCLILRETAQAHTAVYGETGTTGLTERVAQYRVQETSTLSLEACWMLGAHMRHCEVAEDVKGMVVSP